MKTVEPYTGMVITEDTKLKEGVYNFEGDAGITVAADDVVVDGAGAVLRSVTKMPELPGGDFLYTPGNMGRCREEHVLLSRDMNLPAGGSYRFEYRYWGAIEDPAIITFAVNDGEWQPTESEGCVTSQDGWLTCNRKIDAESGGQFGVKFTVPASAVNSDAPSFYDGFRLVSGDDVIWRGDAREHWQNWYNTGFSIFKRAEAKFYSGVALSAEGLRGVHLKNITARGFLTGLRLKNCSEVIIENNDFSGNYDDPDYGWGEGAESYGAIHLDEVSSSLITHNRAEHVWNGLVLRKCTANRIEANTISHCSNTCLKLSQSRDNTAIGNDFSWGLRKYPDEVHARDSVSLLVESGSNDNRFVRNDFSHGGDGVFIRVLNAWCSTGNLFEENDCSYANNNAVEAWSPGNTYLRNKANHSSYGFWLGGSDDTVLIGNEVMHNGKDFANAPEPFGNAGISVVHGSSSGFLVQENRIIGNNGPGIALAFREGRPALNWLIAGNEIRDNRNDTRGYTGHGLFAEYCRSIHVLGNSFTGNEGRDVVLGRSCNRFTVDARPVRVAGDLSIATAHAPVAGEVSELRIETAGDPAVLDALSRFSWDFGDDDERVTDGAAVSHRFDVPGCVRVCVAATGEGFAGIASALICVLPQEEPLVDCSDPTSWELVAERDAHLGVDDVSPFCGAGSTEVTVRDGTPVSVKHTFPGDTNLESSTGISFFYRYGCELMTHTGKHNRTLAIRITDRNGTTMEYSCIWDQAEAPSEERYDWSYLTAPWSAFSSSGAPDMGRIVKLEIGFGPEEHADFEMRIGGVYACFVTDESRC